LNSPKKQQQYQSNDCYLSLHNYVNREADKVYNKIAKEEEANKIITDYSTNIPSSPPQSEQQTRVFQRQAVTNQTRIYTKEYLFVQSKLCSVIFRR
jgi:hypothetical protein